MNANWTIWAIFIAAVLVAAYIFLVRPILKQIPAAKATFTALDSWYTKITKTIKGLKTKLSAWLLIIAGAAVALHDSVMASISGVDVTPITNKIPHDLYPYIAIGVGALFRILRKVTTGPEAK